LNLDKKILITLNIVVFLYLCIIYKFQKQKPDLLHVDKFSLSTGFSCKKIPKQKQKTKNKIGRLTIYELYKVIYSAIQITRQTSACRAAATRSEIKDFAKCERISAKRHLQEGNSKRCFER